MDKYIDMFSSSDNESLKKILDWKIKRVMKWVVLLVLDYMSEKI
jgi:hypothetical protein